MDSINILDMDHALAVIDQLLEPQEALFQLLKSGRAKLTGNSIDYPVGLQSLVETLIRDVRDIPVYIKAISYQFGQLEVGFQMLKQCNELRVWKAIDKARRESQQTCQGCGGYANRKVRGGKVTVICAACQKKLDASGETGTWLDKY